MEDGYCLNEIDRANAQSTIQWLIYGIENKDNYPFEILINAAGFEYANSLANVAYSTSTTEFVNKLKGHFKDSQISCDGLIVSSPDSIQVWTSGWSPPWKIPNSSSQSNQSGFFLSQQNGEWRLVTAYLDKPESFYTENFVLTSCDSLDQLDLSAKFPLADQWIAFLNNKDIWFIHPDGSALTQVTKNDGDNPPIKIFKWSPDGGTLAYSQGSNIYLYDVQTLKTEILETGGAGGFDWSLNGRQILYDAAFSKDNPWTNNGLWVINLQNGNKRRVVSGSSMNPLWSSEGSHVIFAIPAFEPAGYGVADFSTGESISLPLNSSGSAGNCAWAPSELIIACITYTDEWPYKPEIRLLDVNGNIMQEILLPERMSGNFIIHWSPNGEKLAISYLAGGSADTLLDILLINKRNFSTLAIGFISDWSPDGEWILSWGGGKVPFPIYLTNTISGDSVQIAEGMFPVWQP